MIKFKDISFSEFIELINFLKFNDDELEYHNITKRLTRFIGDMNAYRSIVLDNLVKDILDKKEDAEESFNLFKEENPELPFDPEGKLDLVDFDYFEISLQSLELLYTQATERIKNGIATKIDYQVSNAKTLKPLLEMEGRFEYPIKKVLYFKKNKQPVISSIDLKKANDQIKEIFQEENNIMGKFLEFIFNKKYENCFIFVEHFLKRLDILYRDKKLTHPVNREFYEILKKI